MRLSVFQGMGYLHAKGIVHKDLKSKNVFYDNGKVVITDFRLFGISGVVREGRSVGLGRPERLGPCWWARGLGTLAVGGQGPALPIGKARPALLLLLWFRFRIRFG